MDTAVLLALISKLVEEKIKDLPSTRRGPRGFPGEKGEPGKDFNYAEHEQEIKNILGDISLKFENFTDEQIEKITGPRGPAGRDGRDGRSFDMAEHEETIRAWAKEFALKFSDLTEEDIESLRGPKGDRGLDGKAGRDGKDFNLEESLPEVSKAISETVFALSDSLKLKFSDLSEEEVAQLRGPRGRDGRPGKDFNFEEHREFFESLKPKFSDFTFEEVEKLKLKFDDLSDEEKASLKLRFVDLTDEEKLSLKGPRGQRGKSGRDGIDGKNGIDGKQGIQGLPGIPGKPGRDGIEGRNGIDGKDAPYITAIDVSQRRDKFTLVFKFSDGSEIESESIDLPNNIKETWVIGGGVSSSSGGGGGGTGADGKSAYEIWLELGNTGTEQDFIDSLQGADGAAGPQGPPGDVGPQGPPGSDASVQGYPDYSEKLQTMLAIIAAHDRVADISYDDDGLRTMRMSGANYTSALYPDSEITISVSYLDVGSINQRIDQIDINGGALGASILSKVYEYVPQGTKQKLTGYYYELN